MQATKELVRRADRVQRERSAPRRCGRSASSGSRSAGGVVTTLLLGMVKRMRSCREQKQLREIHRKLDRLEARLSRSVPRARTNRAAGRPRPRCHPEG